MNTFFYSFIKIGLAVTFRKKKTVLSVILYKGILKEL